MTDQGGKEVKVAPNPATSPSPPAKVSHSRQSSLTSLSRAMSRLKNGKETPAQDEAVGGSPPVLPEKDTLSPSSNRASWQSQQSQKQQQQQQRPSVEYVPPSQQGKEKKQRQPAEEKKEPNNDEKKQPTLAQTGQDPQPRERMEDDSPLLDELPTISAFFLGSSVAIIVVCRLLHWLVGLVLALVLAHVLRSMLTRAAGQHRYSQALAMKAQQQQKSKSNGAFTMPAETVEWMNSVLDTVWPLITQQYFVPFIDLLEDALMQQVPGIVHSCRVEDLDQGTVPLQVQSIALLDRSEAAFLGRKEEDKLGDEDVDIDVGDFVNLEITFAYRSPARRRQRKGKTSNKAPGLEGEDEAQKKKQDEKKQAEQDSEAPASDTAVDQIHLLIYMAIGLQKIAAIEVPVWCEMLAIEGKMRLRLQLTPVAPFVKHVAFTLVGKPHLEMSARPLGRRMVLDAMHLPLISSYVLHSVEAVLQNFIMPKAYTVDVAGLLGAGDGPQNVYGLGVIVVVIHQGIELPAADANGYSDPFVSLSFAKAGRPLFTTRVLVKTRDPIWQELAIIPISQDEVRDHEKLRMTVFDADRFSRDDPLGKVDISIDALINRAIAGQDQDQGQGQGQRNGGNAQKPGQTSSWLEQRTEKLEPIRRGMASVKGRLSYSVGFFRLSHPKDGKRNAGRTQVLKKAAERANGEEEEEGKIRKEVAFAEGKDTNGETEDEEKKEQQQQQVAEFKGQGQNGDDEDVDLRTPFDRFVTSLGLPLDSEVMAQRRARKARVAKLVGLIGGESAATYGSHDEQWPSGILAFHIHAIDSLGIETNQRSFSASKRLGQKPRYDGTAMHDAGDDGGDEGGNGAGATRMPSSYVQVLLNDEAIFRTRTKTLNPRPFINAGSERWVADFGAARIDFVVRDARQREADAILGVVGMELRSVLSNSCRSTQWYTLSGGLGWGKIKVTLLWRSVAVTIPRQMMGWNVGVVEIAACRVYGVHSSLAADKRAAHVLFETVGGRAATKSVEAVPVTSKGKEEEVDNEKSRDEVSYTWTLDEPVRIAVRQRYPNWLYIHLRADSRMPGRNHRRAHTVLPLNRLIDGNVTRREAIPLYETTNWQHFEQDVLKGITKRSQLASTTSQETHRAPILDELCREESREDVLRRLEQIDDSDEDDDDDDDGGALSSDSDKEGQVEGKESGYASSGGGSMRRDNKQRQRRSSTSSRATNKSSIKKQPHRHRLKRIGWLDLTLIFHPGIAMEHGSITAGDHEMRFSYEAFLAQTDCGQRAKPKSLSKAKRQKLMLTTSTSTSLAAGRRPSGGNAEMVRSPDEVGAAEINEAYGRNSLHLGNDQAGLRDLDGDDDDDDDDDESERDSLAAGGADLDGESRRARRRTLHRQERGAAQIKTFRTFSWIKTNAEDGLGRIKRMADQQQRKKVAKMENEGVSRF